MALLCDSELLNYLRKSEAGLFAVRNTSVKIFR